MPCTCSFWCCLIALFVTAELPTGQVSNHYELKDWDLFKCPEQEYADKWDGHTPQMADERILEYIKKYQNGDK